jgi:predicted RNA-binding Zn ribbon-like protein
MTEHPSEQTDAAPARFRSGSGRLCLDFMRTLRLRGQADATEELPTPAALAEWIRQLGPYAADAPLAEPTRAQLNQARQLREAVHALLTAARGPQGPAGCPSEARALLNRAAAEPVPSPVLDEHGHIVHTAAHPVPAVLATIARDALDLATSPALDRVRACLGPNCAAWFLDSSRPGNRRWCSMDSCGSQAKKSSWRARQHAASAG